MGDKSLRFYSECFCVKKSNNGKLRLFNCIDHALEYKGAHLMVILVAIIIFLSMHMAFLVIEYFDD